MGPVATTRVDVSSPGGDVKGMTALAEQSKRDTLSRNPPGGTDASLMSRRHALIRAEKRHAYACAQAQRLPQAIALYQKICERDPGDAEAWFMLGTLRGRSGDNAGAEAALRQALAVFPEFAQACLNLGHALEVHGNSAEAEACYLRAVALKPDLAEAHEALGRLCQQRGEWPAAEEHYQVALRLHPAAVGAALALAALLTRRGRPLDALAALEQAWHHDHTSGELACALARVCLDLDRCEDALHYVQHARRQQPDLAAAHTLEVEILLRRGARAEAEALLAPLLPRYREHPAIALAYGALSVGSDHACGAVARLEGVLAETTLDDSQRRRAHFRLAALYDDLQDYDKAMAHFRAAHHVAAAGFDLVAFVRRIDGLIATFSAEAIARAPRAGNCSERPLFVVGMPHAGTEIAAHLLGRYPGMVNAGPLPDLPALARDCEHELAALGDAPLMHLRRERYDAYAQRYLTRTAAVDPDARRVIDALPENFLHLGLVTLLFPVAHIIHCVREPLDTCFACYTADDQGRFAYADELEHLGGYYRQYQRLMTHWREALQTPILEVRYQDLVNQPERVLREMVRFCGLRWIRQTYQDAPPPSHPVAAQPIRGQWHHYQSHLESLRQALAGK